jgi:hypothetical protein
LTDRAALGERCNNSLERWRRAGLRPARRDGKLEPGGLSDPERLSFGIRHHHRRASECLSFATRVQHSWARLNVRLSLVICSDGRALLLLKVANPQPSCKSGHRVIHGSWFLTNSLSLLLTRSAVDVLLDESWHDLTLDDALLPRTLSIDA